jgi:hypothetical protein
MRVNGRLMLHHCPSVISWIDLLCLVSSETKRSTDKIAFQVVHLGNTIVIDNARVYEEWIEAGAENADNETGIFTLWLVNLHEDDMMIINGVELMTWCAYSCLSGYF